MSYLAQPTSKTEYGVTRVGDRINVTEDGNIWSPELVAGAGITVNYLDETTITISATGADLISVRGVTSNYTLTADDEYLGVSSSSAVTITLPSGVNGRVYTIKDEYGQGSGKITIQPNTGELIDGKTNYVIGIPYQSVSLVFRNNSWWIV
jgi:hypothetical protein